MNKHTPGPWQATGAHIVRSLLGLEFVANCAPAAKDRNSLPHQKRAAANARLIAAAPEMLAALQAFLDYDDNDLDDGAAIMLLYVAATDVARAAIARATGATA